MPTADVPGARLHYELVGTGPRLLLVNGTGSDLRKKPNVLDGPIVRHFTVLTYEHRGLGRSRATDLDAQPTMADFGTDALALADALGWDDFALMGVSFGGMVAQHTALGAAPGRITKLLLACTSSGGAGGASAPLHELYPLDSEERIARSVALTDLRTHTDETMRADKTALVRTGAAADDPATYPGLAKQLEARRHHDTWERLPALTMPTLVAAGRHDGIAPLANAEALASRIPGAELRVFEGGHVFFLDDRTAWPSMIEWLQR
jgi:3-oxoadipate enol-lactonase